jgi:phosphoenolpyruvate carboxykinase (ATP)
MLNPKNMWRDKHEYDEYLMKVANMFKDNFHRFDKDASEEVKAGGPQF